MSKRKISFLGEDSNGFIHFKIDDKRVMNYNSGRFSFSRIYVEHYHEIGDYRIDVEFIGRQKLQRLIKEMKIEENYRFLEPIDRRRAETIVWDLKESSKDVGSKFYGAEVVADGLYSEKI